MIEVSDEQLKKIRNSIDSKLAVNHEFRTIVKRIDSGKATFADTAEYSRILARIIGNELSANVLELSDREQITQQLLQYGYKDINEVCARVQESLDRNLGVSIRPKNADFPEERVQQFSHSLVDPTVDEKVIQRRARAGTETITKSFHDDYIQKNAQFRHDAGLKCYIERIGSDCCKWCTDVAGKYLFGTQPKDIFRRHDNCNCTIIYDGQRMQGRMKADGTRSKTWGKLPNGKEIEQQKLSKIAGLKRR